MGCGDIKWWRAPSPDNILVRHGTAEHLIIQIDFLLQPQRDGRAEYSIPGSGKVPTADGFADIVSLASGEIWEIKPEHLEDSAVAEANWYVKNATKSCKSRRWIAGTTYTSSNRYDVPGLVYRSPSAGGMVAELYASQGKPGAVLYHWEINGKRNAKLQAKFAWALRAAVVAEYFPRGTFKPAGAVKEPTAVPLGRFQSPVLLPNNAWPGLRDRLGDFTKEVWRKCAPQILENGAVEVLAESVVYDKMAGQSQTARAVQSMQVQRDPTVELYRYTLDVAVGVPLLIWGIVGVTLLAGVPAGEVFVGTAAPAASAAPAVGTGAVIFVLSPGFKETVTAAAAAAASIVFFWPTPSRADPSRPVAINVAAPLYRAVSPSQADKSAIGDRRLIQGVEWRVIAIARTLPDQT